VKGVGRRDGHRQGGDGDEHTGHDETGMGAIEGAEYQRQADDGEDRRQDDRRPELDRTGRVE
jgi:hypothetical protein